MTNRYFIPEQAQRTLRCDRTELLTMALQLLDQCHQTSAALELALLSGEWRAVDSQIHRLRSGCAVLGIEAVCTLVRLVQVKTDQRTVVEQDLQSLAGALRDLTVELIDYVTDARSDSTQAMPLAA